MTKKAKIKRILFVVLALGVFTSCLHKMYDALDWQSKKVTVDGKIPEWSNPLRFYDYKSKINYAITNDRKNLYLAMKISDEVLKAKIIRGGMEFRIDTLGKKSFPIAFIFPIANQMVIEQHKRMEVQPERKAGEKPDRSVMNQKLLGQAKEAHLIGFKPPLGGNQSLINNPSGISAAINIDSLGIMYYEAAIPFSTFYKKELTASDTNKVFSYEIKVNALPAPPEHKGGGGEREMGSGMHGGGGGMGGGHHGGGMGGGGMHSGGHGSNGANTSANSELYESNKITTTLKFSYK